jgi:hypothetical protein
MDIGLTCFTAFQSASPVCAEIIGDHRLAAAAHRRRDHDREALSVLLEHLLDRNERRLGVQRIEDRLDQEDVGAAGDQRADLLDVRRLDLIERDDAEAGVIGIGRVGERHGQRADRSGHEPPLPIGAADLVGPLAALASRDLVDLVREVPEELVLDDLLVELRILAAAVLARVVDEELALRDARRSERVGLDDVRAGFEEAPVDVADHVRLREREDVAVVEQVLGRVLEPLAANVCLGHPVRADGRAHRAVDDGDALLEEALEGVTCGVAHELTGGLWEKAVMTSK